MLNNKICKLWDNLIVWINIGALNKIKLILFTIKYCVDIIDQKIKYYVGDMKIRKW